MAFEKFTATARQVVITAQEEARGLNHNYIGTEHILLGLLDDPTSVAGKVLHQLGFTADGTRADITRRIGPGASAPRGHIPFTPRAKKTLDLALRESRQLRHTYIGPEHILLALVREGEGAGAKVLAERVDPISRVRDAVLAALEGSAATDTWPAGTPATNDAVSAASALAGGAPVGSHHLLEAMLRAEDSMAARVLRELGVDPDAVAAKIDELDPETTSDANPEEAAARGMELRLVDDEVHLILRDQATLTLARKVAELSADPIRGVGPIAGLFIPLWRSTNQLLAQVQQLLEPEDDTEPTTNKATRAVRAVLASRLRGRGN